MSNATDSVQQRLGQIRSTVATIIPYILSGLLTFAGVFVGTVITVIGLGLDASMGELVLIGLIPSIAPTVFVHLFRFAARVAGGSGGEEDTRRTTME
jgi:hypothetical protein